MSSPYAPRDFPDRAIRDALTHPDHLRAVLLRVAPEVAERFDYQRREIIQRPYLTDDWRKRDADLLIRLPLLPGATGQEVLVCLLLEHQSSADPVMPLRLLVYAVLYWEREWLAWEQHHERGEPLRLTPILPVVYHTGPTPWQTNRELSELLAGSEEVRAWAPRWPARFFDLVEHPATALLQAGEAWWQAMAVVRAEWAEAPEFATVFTEALRRLESWAGVDRVGWQQLVRLMLYWGLFRRPRAEHTLILDSVRSSLAQGELLREVETMAHQLEQTWEQELLATGEARGEARGQKRGEELGHKRGEELGEKRGELKAHRKFLVERLQKRFGPLSEELQQRIERAELPSLVAALDQVDSLQALEDLRL